jgi:hypothetical protein
VRLAEEEAPAAHPVELTTETIAGDSRTAFVLEAGQRLELGPFETAGGCRLRFGLGSPGPAGPDGTSPALRLAARHAGTATPLRPDPDQPLRAGSGAWRDYELGTPDLPAGSWSLVGEVAGDPGQDGGPALLWGSPHRSASGGPPPRRRRGPT